MSQRAKQGAWLAWMAAALVMTASSMAWHIGYFRSPGPQFYVAAVAGLPLLAVAAIAWSLLRRGFWWRCELLLLAAPATLLVVMREPRASLVVLALFVSAYGTGRLLLGRFGVTIESRVASIGLTAAAGFGLLHVALFALAMSRVLYWWTMLPLLVLPLFFAAPVASDVRALVRQWADAADLRSPLAGLLVPFTALFTLCTAAVALAPSIAFDSFKMHLPLAQYYLQQHALDVKPGLDYSFFPQSAELVLALTMQFGGQAAAQLVSPLFFILSLLMIWAIARQCGATAAGAFCGVVFAVSMPFFHWSGSVVKNDLQLVLFQLAALYALLRWRATGSFRWALLAALFVGCSFGVKHPALFGGLPLGILLLWAAWRQPRRLRALAMLLLLIVLSSAMWHVRTFALTGSPVYPLKAGESATPERGEDKDLWARVARVAALPFTIHFAGYYHFESPSATPMGIVLLFFLPVWLLSGRLSEAERICLFFVVVSFFAWGWLSPMIRYIESGLAVLAALTASRAARLFDEWHSVPRWSLGAAAVWSMALALCSIMVVEINAPQLRYLAGRVGWEEYLRAAMVPYPSIEFVTRHTTAADRILGVENCIDVYAPPSPRFYSECAGSPWTAPMIAQRLRASHYTWMVAPADKRVETLEALQTCKLRAQERYADAAFVVYRLE